jgi:hypothetical protein
MNGSCRSCAGRHLPPGTTAVQVVSGSSNGWEVRTHDEWNASSNLCPGLF